jgi:hypothetical protein
MSASVANHDLPEAPPQSLAAETGDPMLPSRTSSRRIARRRRSLGASLECLEPRIALSTFSVSNESELRAAIATADGNSDGNNTIDITASITLSDVAAGQLVIQDAASTPGTLTIEGQGASPADTVIAGSSGWNTRIFEVVGTGTANVTVVFKDLAIKGGHAIDGGVLGGAVALGGGLLIDGGQVTLSQASVAGNAAQGAGGADGAAVTGDEPGNPGGAGGGARGGGI